MAGAESVTLELDLGDIALLRDLCLRFKKLESKLPESKSTLDAGR